MYSGFFQKKTYSCFISFFHFVLDYILERQNEITKIISTEVMVLLLLLQLCGASSVSDSGMPYKINLTESIVLVKMKKLNS